jgi:bacterioferritin-associated ferredoxin
MYVCLCNSITEKEIRTLAADGVADAEAAYARLGSEVNCGQCLDFAQMLLDQHGQHARAIDMVGPDILRAPG